MTNGGGIPASPPKADAVFDGLSRALVPPVGVGGRLQSFLSAWRTLTSDAYVLSIVRDGFSIALAGPLPGGAIRRRTPPTGAPTHQLLATEIAALLKKGAIERVRDHSHLCLSPVFIIPKRSGNFRMILNLKRINTFIPSASFRMETLSTILPLLRPNDLAVSLDLRDAYLHVPIHPSSRDLLGFSVNGKTYRYRAMPFGLKPAPRVFSRLVSEVAAYLRGRGLRLFCYLDDWLLVADSEQLLAAQVLILVQTVQALGFIINWDKSELSPTHTPIFLGAEIDLRNQLARPSPDRIQKIRRAAAALRRTRRTSARKFLQFVGYLASLVDVLPDCRLFMRPFQHHLLRFYRPSRDPLSSQIPIPAGIRLLLARWTDFSFLSQGKPLRVPQPSITVTTDASLQGWGGHCQGNMVAGRWSHRAAIRHINVLEFQAVQLSLQQFLPLLRGRTVLIRTDNVTVAAYINKQGGTRSTNLSSLAAQFWKWCRHRDITPVASYLPGQDNLIADFLSRGRCLPSEWMLHPEVMSLIQRTMGPLRVDLFASALNHQLPLYCSRVQDPGAWALDAFSISWRGIQAYAFPPIALIPRVLRKIREDKAVVLLVAPYWPRRPWFLELFDLLASRPMSLPLRPDLVIQPVSGILHQQPASLHLTAWPLSGNRPDNLAFQTGQQNLSCRATGTPLGRSTIRALQPFRSGASLGV